MEATGSDIPTRLLPLLCGGSVQSAGRCLRRALGPLRGGEKGRATPRRGLGGMRYRGRKPQARGFPGIVPLTQPQTWAGSYAGPCVTALPVLIVTPSFPPAPDPRDPLALCSSSPAGTEGLWVLSGPGQLLVTEWYKEGKEGTSLVAQWLRIHLPMQGTWVQALVREDPTCHRATKPARRNY